VAVYASVHSPNVIALFAVRVVSNKTRHVLFILQRTSDNDEGEM
jgi:hypothetical protein